MRINTYLMFNGNAEEATAFYAELLSAKVENLYRYGDMPPIQGYEIPAEYAQKIGHCCLVFDGGSLSIADTVPSDPRNFGSGNMLTLSCDSVEQAEAAYAYLAKEAQKINCEMCEVFYAKRYGELVDKYGILWGVMYEEQ